MNRTEYKSAVGHFRRETRDLPMFDTFGMLSPMSCIYLGAGDDKVMVYRHAGPDQLASAMHVRTTATTAASALVGLISHATLFKDKHTRRTLIHMAREIGKGARVPIPG